MASVSVVELVTVYLLQHGQWTRGIEEWYITSLKSAVMVGMKSIIAISHRNSFLLHLIHLLGHSLIMRQNMLSVALAVGPLSFLPMILAGNPVYQPCPLLKAYYPMPTIDKNAEAVKSFTKGFTTLFDQLVKAGGSEDFGEITPNTTSFSVVLFSGSDGAEEDPVFFEYHYVAPEAPQNSTLNSNTMLPLGTLTQLFTVYAWLVELGDEQWGKPITEYLPELNRVSKGEMKVQWDDITVGSLAGQMSGLARECEFAENVCQHTDTH